MYNMIVENHVEKFLKKALELYTNIGIILTVNDLIADIEDGYLTINTAKNLCDYMWFFDGEKEGAISWEFDGSVIRDKEVLEYLFG